MQKDIVVIHEYGAINHYHGLVSNLKNFNSQVEFREFGITRQFLKGIYRKDSKLLWRSIQNFLFLVRLIFNRDSSRKFVIGIAPYDYRVIFFNFALRQKEYYLHTSWPNWHIGDQPKGKNFFKKHLWSEFIQKCSGAFVVTNAVKNSMQKVFPSLDDSFFHVVYHSIDESFYQSAELYRGIPKSDSLNVGFVGRMDESKGVLKIKEIAQLNPNVLFTLVGKGSLFKSFSLKNVSWLPEVSDRKELAKIMCTFDLLLLPSQKTGDWEEAFGMVIIEALCCNVFPVVTNHIGPTELIRLTSGLAFKESHFVDNTNEIIKIWNDNLVENRKKNISLYLQSELFLSDSIATRWEFFKYDN